MASTQPSGAGAGGDRPLLRVAPQPRARLLNRDASWLDYNRRVLALAASPQWPVLERVRSLAFASRNLDDFFQVRGAVLAQNLQTGLSDRSPDGLTTAEQMEVLRVQGRAFAAEQETVYIDSVAPALTAVGISLLDYHDIRHRERTVLDAYFAERVFPVLTPLAVDPAHPFPYISSLSLNLAVVVADPDAGAPRLARVKVPPTLPRFIPLGQPGRFARLEQVISAHLDALFPGMDIVSHHPFRVTRGANFEVESDEDDLLEAVRDVLKRRRLSPLVVRLEVVSGISDDVLGLLVRELQIDRRDVHVTAAPLDLGSLFEITSMDRPDLRFPPLVPSVPVALAGGEGPFDVFAAVRSGDVVVHHPYEDFTASAVAFVEQAAADPAVLAIKQTLYRTSGQSNPIVHALIRAAEAGKQVVALVELTARFDEQANISWAEALEQAGVHVIYGMVGLKTHAKVSLVVRREESRITRYCHVSTGNYNPETARQYEDIALLTNNDDICADLGELFNALSGYSRDLRYRRVLVAPAELRAAVVQRIHRQASPAGRVILKVNGLLDGEIIESLYEAADAGAEVDLIVRGMCALNPAASSAPQRLRVRSIVGRHLEHSRIYRFGTDKPEYFISSADLMPRNLDRRVEVAVPIDEPRLRARLDEILWRCLEDDELAWSFDGATWRRVPTRRGINAQEALQESALRRNRGGG